MLQTKKASRGQARSVWLALWRQRLALRRAAASRSALLSCLYIECCPYELHPDDWLLWTSWKCPMSSLLQELKNHAEAAEEQRHLDQPEGLPLPLDGGSQSLVHQQPVNQTSPAVASQPSNSDAGMEAASGEAAAPTQSEAADKAASQQQPAVQESGLHAPAWVAQLAGHPVSGGHQTQQPHATGPTHSPAAAAEKQSPQAVPMDCHEQEGHPAGLVVPAQVPSLQRRAPSCPVGEAAPSTLRRTNLLHSPLAPKCRAQSSPSPVCAVDRQVKPHTAITGHSFEKQSPHQQAPTFKDEDAPMLDVLRNS